MTEKRQEGADSADSVGSGFDLVRPTEEYSGLSRYAPQHQANEPMVLDHPTPDVSFHQGGWKGIDDPEAAPQPREGHQRSRSFPDASKGMDMTPMVDVTFLLLIFFMVTASFTLQKVLEQPHAKTDSIGKEDPLPPASDFVQVAIDPTNTYYVTTQDHQEIECPSESEMRARVKAGFASGHVDRLLVVAHVESLHSKVISAWDAGAINGASTIEIQTTDHSP